MHKYMYIYIHMNAICLDIFTKLTCIYVCVYIYNNYTYNSTGPKGEGQHIYQAVRAETVQ